MTEQERAEALAIIARALKTPAGRVVIATGFGHWTLRNLERNPAGVPTNTIISAARLLLIEHGPRE